MSTLIVDMSNPDPNLHADVIHHNTVNSIDTTDTADA